MKHLFRKESLFYTSGYTTLTHSCLNKSLTEAGTCQQDTIFCHNGTIKVGLNACKVEQY